MREIKGFRVYIVVSGAGSPISYNGLPGLVPAVGVSFFKNEADAMADAAARSHDGKRYVVRRSYQWV